MYIHSVHTTLSSCWTHIPDWPLRWRWWVGRNNMGLRLQPPCRLLQDRGRLWSCNHNLRYQKRLGSFVVQVCHNIPMDRTGQYSHRKNKCRWLGFHPFQMCGILVPYCSCSNCRPQSRQHWMCHHIRTEWKSIWSSNHCLSLWCYRYTLCRLL